MNVPIPARISVPSIDEQVHSSSSVFAPSPLQSAIFDKFLKAGVDADADTRFVDSKIIKDRWEPLPLPVASDSTTTTSSSRDDKLFGIAAMKNDPSKRMFRSSDVMKSTVLTEETSAEGLAISRYKTKPLSQQQQQQQDHGDYSSSSESEYPYMPLDNDRGHIFSLLKGSAKLKLQTDDANNELGIDSETPLTIAAGTHMYIPPHHHASIAFSTSQSSYAIHVSGQSEYATGTKLLIRNERFARSARDTLTPQYLSRRIFTNRDETLTSKYGTKIAWFHTTMFDSTGLAVNDEGKPVFKMSYNDQTEPNVVYEVGGIGKVRFAIHPYLTSSSSSSGSDKQKQVWSDWRSIDEDVTYYLNETADGKEVEKVVKEVPVDTTNKSKNKDSKAALISPAWPSSHEIQTETKISTLRNRHEVYIQPSQSQSQSAFVSLCCLFDPGPTGLEVHQPGEYSSYGPVSETVQTPEYQEFVRRMAPVDEMIDVLSLEAAKGRDDESLKKLPQWSIFEAEKMKQLEKQTLLVDQLAKEGNGREKIVEAWRLKSD